MEFNDAAVGGALLVVEDRVQSVIGSMVEKVREVRSESQFVPRAESAQKVDAPSPGRVFPQIKVKEAEVSKSLY